MTDETRTDAPVTDPADTESTEVILVDGTLDDATAALLAAGFADDAAEVIAATAQNKGVSELITMMMGGIDPDDMGQRVAGKVDLLDNTASMRALAPLMGKAHDQALNMLQRVTANEPVDVLAAAMWLNDLMGGKNGNVIYPFTRVEKAPRFNGAPIHMGGNTAWLDRYAELLTVFAQILHYLEENNKTFYGMMGLYCDGLDNASKEQTIESLSKIVRSYRRGKTHVPYVVYMGSLPDAGSFTYDEEVRRVKSFRLRMGFDNNDPELLEGGLEALIRDIFHHCGFDPKMVFMPGDDMSEIVAVFVSVSKMFASMSKGQVPEGLSEI